MLKGTSSSLLLPGQSDASDSVALGTASLITQTPFSGFAVFTATTGADIRMRARTEIASSAITLSAGRTIMICRRIG